MLITVAVGEALVADDATGEADQNRHEGGRARPVCHLPDGGSGRAQAAVPGDPGADTMVATARNGAGMMARTVETAREGEGDEDGLRESATDTSTGAPSGNIMGRQQPDLPALEQTGTCVLPSP